MESIGSRIVNLRVDKDIKQSDLAKTVGITKSMLSKYENNINIPKGDIIAKLADSLNTTTDYLLCRTNNKGPLMQTDKFKFLNDYQLQLFLIASSLDQANKTRLLERAITLLEIQNSK